MTASGICCVPQGAKTERTAWGVGWVGAGLFQEGGVYVCRRLLRADTNNIP